MYPPPFDRGHVDPGHVVVFLRGFLVCLSFCMFLLDFAIEIWNFLLALFGATWGAKWPK